MLPFLRSRFTRSCSLYITQGHDNCHRLYGTWTHPHYHVLFLCLQVFCHGGNPPPTSYTGGSGLRGNLLRSRMSPGLPTPEEVVSGGTYSGGSCPQWSPSFSTDARISTLCDVYHSCVPVNFWIDIELTQFTWAYPASLLVFFPPHSWPVNNYWVSFKWYSYAITI